MNILIIGLGYAGKRYQRAFEYLRKNYSAINLNISYVGRVKKDVALPYYASIDEALHDFNPDIVVVSVNDKYHANVLYALEGYQGFVICEKPLVTQYDEIEKAIVGLKNVKGFALDLVERYSEATRKLRDFIVQNNCNLVRAHFYWGKDRINDYRPTCGVISEIIHAFDLVEWIYSQQGQIILSSISGINSDFSISGDSVMDSAFITASLGNGIVTGYSSFVNIVRQRTVDFSFIDKNGRLLHARITYDTPYWDCDHLQIWTRNHLGRQEIIVDYRTDLEVFPAGLETIYKLSALCDDVLNFCAFNTLPVHPFADIETSRRLQLRLNDIASQSDYCLNAKYFHGGERIFQSEDSELETLG